MIKYIFRRIMECLLRMMSIEVPRVNYSIRFVSFYSATYTCIVLDLLIKDITMVYCRIYLAVWRLHYPSEQYAPIKHVLCSILSCGIGTSIKYSKLSLYKTLSPKNISNTIYWAIIHSLSIVWPWPDAAEVPVWLSGVWTLWGGGKIATILLNTFQNKLLIMAMFVFWL